MAFFRNSFRNVALVIRLLEFDLRLFVPFLKGNVCDVEAGAVRIPPGLLSIYHHAIYDAQEQRSVHEHLPEAWPFR